MKTDGTNADTDVASANKEAMERTFMIAAIVIILYEGGRDETIIAMLRVSVWMVDGRGDDDAQRNKERWTDLQGGVTHEHEWWSSKKNPYLQKIIIL